jgi:hypothetical protein
MVKACAIVVHCGLIDDLAHTREQLIHGVEEFAALINSFVQFGVCHLCFN